MKYKFLELYNYGCSVDQDSGRWNDRENRLEVISVFQEKNNGYLTSGEGIEEKQSQQTHQVCHFHDEKYSGNYSSLAESTQQFSVLMKNIFL